MKNFIMGILAVFLLVPAANAANFIVRDNDLEITGRINPGDQNFLANYLISLPEMKVILLDSIGGDVDTGWKMAEMIRARGVDTRVEKSCASACTYVFMGGVGRSATPDAKFQYHPATLAVAPEGWTTPHVFTGGQYHGVKTMHQYQKFGTPGYENVVGKWLAKVYLNTWHTQLYTASYGEMQMLGFINR